MASIRNNNRYTLSLKPVDYSLTAGTNIPAPLDTPPRSPAGSARPPTSGGGPLTSHPATPEDMPGAYPITPSATRDLDDLSKINTSMFTGRVEKADSFRTPYSPASAVPTNTTSSPEQPQRRPSGVRRLLSLSSLRSSFNSSRTSLSLPRQPSDAPAPAVNTLKRPSTASIKSHAESTNYQPRPDLRRKKSSGWFKRKSGMFMLNDDNILDAVDESTSRPDTRDSKRLKETIEPAPLLPEVGTLKGGRIGNGEIGWDENLFGR
ncbi:hypothetical protein LTR86_009392 [Recurvomyces mirabilis]|nr:hypothetical protein LTR86_009392 [Recurvomyces mirabilis]